MKVKILNPIFVNTGKGKEWKVGDIIDLGKKQAMEAIEKGYAKKISKKNVKQKKPQPTKSSGRCWSIFPKDNGLYNIENHETKQHAFIDPKTEQGRHSAFGLMKKIGLNESQRGKIWTEIYKQIQPCKILLYYIFVHCLYSIMGVLDNGQYVITGSQKSCI